MKWPGGGAHIKRKGNIFVFQRKSIPKERQEEGE